MKKLKLSFLLVVSCIGITFSQVIPDSEAYLGQTPPGAIRKIFNLAADQGYFCVEKIAISPDGKEIYFEEVSTSWASFKIKYYKYSNNQWNGPFNLFNNFYCLSLSPDGNFMYFENNNYNDSWISVRQDSIWSVPLRFLEEFNVHSLNVTNLGNYYLSSNPAGGLGQRDICKLIVENSDTTLVGLGLPLNSSYNEGDFFISNDESFIILMSNRSGGFGSTDLYVSFKKSNNAWTNPKNLGTTVNTSGDDFGPYVTADNKYLFYESGYSSPSSIYWIKIDELVDSLKYTNFVPYLRTTIPDLTVLTWQSFNYTVPDSIFVDDDGNNTLIYSAKLNNGNPLPEWLTFNPTTNIFSGTPTIMETLNIRITATDSAGETAFTTFKIKVGSSAIDPLIKHDIKISPNPATKLINISANTFSGKTAVVELINIYGKLILSNTYPCLSTEIINVSELPRGIYLLKIIIDKEHFSKKICLE